MQEGTLGTCFTQSQIEQLGSGYEKQGDQADSRQNEHGQKNPIEGCALEVLVVHVRLVAARIQQSACHISKMQQEHGFHFFKTIRSPQR